MADLFEPWVVNSALVISLLAAVNVWLYVLSVRIGRDEPLQMPRSSKNLSLYPRQQPAGAAQHESDRPAA